MTAAITKPASNSRSRRRNRISIVCNFCKKRKVKCDKGQPCKSCIRYGNTDCVYDNLGIDEDLKSEREYESLQNEIKILKARLEKLQYESDNFDRPPPGYLQINTSSSPGDSNSAGSRFQELLGENPIAAHDDRTSFYKSEELGIKSKKGKKLRRAYLPFDWISLMRSDNILSHVANHIVQMSATKGDIEKTSCGYSHIDEDFESKTKTIEGKADLEEYSLTSTEGNGTGSLFSGEVSSNEETPMKDKNNIKHEINKNGLFLGYSFYEGDLGSVTTLCSKISLVLPNKRVLWKLVDIYFSNFYPFAPVFDQQDFTEELEALIGPRTDLEEKPVLRLQKKTDFCLLGSLMLLLRLSYLSLFSHSYEKNYAAFSAERNTDPARRYLLNHPISLDSVSLSRECLNMFDLFTTASLSVFQLALLTRIYTMYAPEEGDGDRGTEISTFNGLLTNMAFSLGLNRDPDIIFGTGMDPRTKNLNRKLWWIVYYLNMVHTLSMGAKCNISSRDYDTKNPVFGIGNNNTAELVAEEAMIKVNARKVSLHLVIDEILMHILNVRGNSDMHAIAQKLSVLEKDVIKGYGTMRNVIKDPLAFSSDFEKISSARYFISTSVLTMSILFNFFNYYEKKNNMRLMAYYVKKLVVMIAYDLLPFCYEIFDNGKLIFKTVSDLPLFPELIKAIHKSTLILVSFLVRCKNDIYRRSNGNDHAQRMADDSGYAKQFHVLNDTADFLQILAEILRETLVDLSPRYFYAWRINKRLEPIFSIVTGNQLYEIIKKVKGFCFDDKYVAEIHHILSSTCRSLREIKAEMDREKTMDNFNYEVAPDDNLGSSIRQMDNAEIDRIWQEMLAVKGNAEDNNDEYNPLSKIANYADVTFDDSSINPLQVAEEMGFDEIVKDFNEINA